MTETAQRKRTVLVVDDDNAMRNGIVLYLEDMGCTVYEASGGREGLALFDKYHPDVVFTDLIMPEVDGLAVLAEITTKSADTPIVVISGNSSVEYAIKAIRTGAWDYITKPINDFAVVDQIFERVLDRAAMLKTEREYKEGLLKAVQSQDRHFPELNNLDPLTKFPLRSQLRVNFTNAISSFSFKGMLSIILVEVSNYKTVTKTFGHEYADSMIVGVAGRLRNLKHHNTDIVKIEAAEFALMIANGTDLSGASAEIRGLFCKPLQILGKEIYATYNIGIASFPTDGESVDTLLQHADVARAYAKSSGRNQYYFYSRELSSQAQSRIELESSMIKALERNEFSLHYQPKLDAKTRRTAGMEVLLRWNQTDASKSPGPNTFVPVLEDLDLITEVGTWVLETACSQYVEWRNQGMEPICMSVNISAVQLQAGELTALVKDILDRTSMEPECLCLEMTESIVVKDLEMTIATLNTLSSLGIKLSIDDFGTGYSSLSYLRKMPINEIKIDRSFVINLPEESASMALVESVLTMSRVMNMTVVAEGVETEEQATFLTKSGCHELQGYLFSKPLPQNDFIKFVLTENKQ